MPGFLYDENEVIERKTNAHISSNGVVTAGAKYVNNPDVRVDVIIIKKAAKVERVTTNTNQGSNTRQPNENLYESPLIRDLS